MSDSRARFEAWVSQRAATTVGVINPWTAWQSAEAAAVRRCADIAEQKAMEYRRGFKGTPGPDGVRRGGDYNPHTDGMSDGAGKVQETIKAEFPQAFVEG